MHRRNALLVATLISGVVARGAVHAAEQKITRAQLPPAVEKTVATESRGATITGFSTETERGQKLYEVELVVDGHGRNIQIDARGEIVEVEEEVPLASLSAAVQAGLKQRAGAGLIGRVESLTKRGTLVAYEAVVRNGKKRSEIQVGPDGTRLAHPE